MTYIVALTGGIGSGKTTVSNRFKKIGVNVIDTDVIGKNIVENDSTISESIKKKFGKKILNLDNSINRSTLRKYIASNKNYQLWLENLLHPKILKETQKKIEIIKSQWCLWVVPLLVEKKLEKKANRILLIDTSVKIQVTRVMKRDKISLQEAKNIILLQTTRKKRISISDDIIFNNSQIKDLNINIYYLNLFYTYLSKKYSQKNHLRDFKKNYLTKFF